MLSSLPPSPVVERSRDIRQVTHLWWALARRTRTVSRQLQAQAQRLCVDSQTLGQRHHQLVDARVPHAPG
jgi:hypothetical protein